MYNDYCSFMKKTKSFFLGLCIATVISFFLAGYSLIVCFVYGPVDENSAGSHFLEISYLFIHIIACGILFYLFFRAMKFGSFFIENVTLDEEKNPYKGKRILFIVLSVIFLFIAVYSTMQISGMNLPLSSELGYVIWHDLMNAMYLLTIIFASFVIYPFMYDKNSAKAN